MSSNGPMGRVTLGALAKGTRVLYWDKDPNGHAMLHEAVVVRARGLGVLLVRTGGSVQFRVTRSEISQVLS